MPVLLYAKRRLAGMVFFQPLNVKGRQQLYDLFVGVVVHVSVSRPRVAIAASSQPSPDRRGSDDLINVFSVSFAMECRLKQTPKQLADLTPLIGQI